MSVIVLPATANGLFRESITLVSGGQILERGKDQSGALSPLRARFESDALNVVAVPGATIDGIVVNIVSDFSRMLRLMNGATSPFSLTHETVTVVDATQRIQCPGGVPYVVSIFASVTLFRDTTANRWRVLA